MKRRHILALLIISGITVPFMQCTKEAERDFARIRTLNASNISQNGATINGEVLNPDATVVEECGFYIYSGTPSENTFAGVGIADYNTVSGQFSYSIETDLVDGHIYYFEAFAKTDPVLSVGNQMSFTSKGSPSPIPLDFSPKNGQVGDTITLVLEKDIFISTGYTVEFNGNLANIVGFEGSSLYVIVPNTLSSQESTVSIKFNDQTINFEDKFNILSPEVISFSPTSVYSGQYVTIEGNNFSQIASYNIVTFNTTRAVVISSSKTKMVVVAPGIFHPQAYITVEIAGQTATTIETIEVLGPQETWTRVANFPVSIFRAQGFAIDGYGYAGTGDSGSSIKQFWKYDHITNIWSAIADFPGQARVSPVASSINGFGYVGGGTSQSFGGVALSDYYKFDPTLNQWEAIGSNPSPIEDTFGESFATVGDKLFVASTATAMNYFSDDPISWNSVTGNNPVFWSASSSFAIGSKLYVILGKNYPNIINEVWMLDTNTLIWQQLNDFPGTPRVGAVGFSIYEKGYIGLGFDGANRLKDTWVYDPDSDSWTRIAEDYPGNAVSSAFVFVIGSSAYIGTGVSGQLNRNNSVYRFTPINIK